LSSKFVQNSQKFRIFDVFSKAYARDRRGLFFAPDLTKHLRQCYTGRGVIMQYRSDDKSGNRLSVLGFGCMRFPRRAGGIDLAKTEALVMQAIDGGVNYFDTAYMYPGSEEALGSILAQNQLRDKVFIASKLPLAYIKSGADFDKFFNIELKRLRSGHIDYYLMHMLTDPGLWKKLQAWGIEQWIAQKKEAGKIKHIGFSFHGSQADFLSLLECYPWEFVQIQYNYSNPNYQAGVAGLKKAHEKGLPVIIMEPLLGGKLANGLPPQAIELFKAPGLEHGDSSPASWALRWLWDQEECTVVLSGMNAPEQLSENLAIAENALPGCLNDEEKAVYDKVRNIFAASYKIPCTGCNYCMPCPQGVNIPGCFAAYNTRSVMGFMAGMQQYMTSVHVTSDKTGRPGQCIRCGTCESHCPQKLPIINHLIEVRKKMEAWPIGAGIGIARAFLGKKK
jgi:predicted aldo/keto reductase-like oxidoreductase